MRDYELALRHAHIFAWHIDAQDASDALVGRAMTVIYRQPVEPFIKY